MPRRLEHAIFFASMLLAGCGDQSGSTAPVPCMPEQIHAACGGDLAGTWALTCYQALPAGVTVTSPPGQTYDFDSSGKFSLVATGLQFVVDIPLTDFVPDGGFNSSWQSCFDADIGAKLFDGSCTAVGDSCSCTYPIPRSAQTGTFSVAENKVTFVQPTTTINEGYCVDGNSLTLLTRFGNFPTPGVFTRQ
jgi:hypothetical protein